MTVFSKIHNRIGKRRFPRSVDHSPEKKAIIIDSLQEDRVFQNEEANCIRPPRIVVSGKMNQVDVYPPEMVPREE